MRLSKIFVSEKQTVSKELKEINLTKKSLGSTVALVGKNGAGKSRVLEFVSNYLDNINVDNYFDDHLTYIPAEIISNYTTNIVEAKRLIDLLKSNNFSETDRKGIHANAANNLKGFLTRLKTVGKAYIKVVDNDDLKTIKASINDNSSLTFQSILSNNHFKQIIDNPQLVQQNEKKTNNSGVLLNEFRAFNNNSTVSYFADLSNRIATDEFNLFLQFRETPEIVNQKIKDKESYQLFLKFQTYVKQFLGKEFSYRQTASGNSVNSVLYYNGKPFSLLNFSPGQKMLFAYAILFFYLDVNSDANIKESIIIIDEPEKHLHPEAQIILVNALKSIVSKSGQLWIATHSVHILSHLEFDEILMVKDDEIIPPSRTTPGKSFNELMGLEEHILELTAFINSISEWAFGNFMVQCFKQPEVIFDNSTNDPQFKLFKEFLAGKRELEILDYGAGKGRTGYTIQEDEEVSAKVLYSAFEPNKTNYEFLNKVPKIKKIYSEKKEIPTNTFDIVLLCNVLHEINPIDWSETLNYIKEVLKEGGYLVILEDRFLPKGETAHEFGYVILNTEETQTLMSAKSSIELKFKEPEYQERIVFNAFKKEQINPSKLTVASSLKQLNDNAYINIKRLKKAKQDLSIGRRLANEMQLFLNSKMALEYFK